MRVVRRQQCAAITNGCTSALIWEETGSASTNLTAAGRRLLTLNGWREDHGRWVCDLHDVAADVEALGWERVANRMATIARTTEWR